MSKNQAWTVWRNVRPWELKPTQSNMSSVISFLESWLVAQPQQHSLIALPSLRDPPLSAWVTHPWSYQRWRLPKGSPTQCQFEGVACCLAKQRFDQPHVRSLQFEHFQCEVRLWQVEFCPVLRSSFQHFTKLPPKKMVLLQINITQKRGLSTHHLSLKLPLPPTSVGSWDSEPEGKVAKLANDDKIWRKVLEAKLNLQVMCDFSQRILNFLHESCSSSMVSTHEFYVVTTNPLFAQKSRILQATQDIWTQHPNIRAVPQLFESSQALKPTLKPCETLVFSTSKWQNWSGKPVELKLPPT